MPTQMSLRQEISDLYKGLPLKYIQEFDERFQECAQMLRVADIRSLSDCISSPTFSSLPMGLRNRLMIASRPTAFHCTISERGNTAPSDPPLPPSFLRHISQACGAIKTLTGDAAVDSVPHVLQGENASYLHTLRSQQQNKVLLAALDIILSIENSQYAAVTAIVHAVLPPPVPEDVCTRTAAFFCRKKLTAFAELAGVTAAPQTYALVQKGKKRMEKLKALLKAPFTPDSSWYEAEAGKEDEQLRHAVALVFAVSFAWQEWKTIGREEAHRKGHRSVREFPWQKGRTDSSHLAAMTPFVFVYTPQVLKGLEDWDGDVDEAFNDYWALYSGDPPPKRDQLGEIVGAEMLAALAPLNPSDADLANLPLYIEQSGIVYSGFDICTMRALFPSLVPQSSHRLGGFKKGDLLRMRFEPSAIALDLTKELQAWDTDMPALNNPKTYQNCWPPATPLPGLSSNLPPGTSPDAVTSALLATHQGVLFGDVIHSQPYDKRGLRDSLVVARGAGHEFELLLEHLTMDLQPWLDQYLSPQWARPEDFPLPLKAYLQNIVGPYNLDFVLCACKELRIPVKLFETSKTYNYDPDRKEAQWRIPAMNLYLTEAISKLSGKKYIAFVGAAHLFDAGTSKNDAPFAPIQCSLRVPCVMYYHTEYTGCGGHPLDQIMSCPPPECNLVIISKKYEHSSVG
mmetsp:Transcript_5978/g.15169  ORF Transcript_5978/g.15169 Transcript_5978/m.15169 type:complete len:683 (+) Transcript_5978:252-2300(+)|eukprot:CAMPEP_0177682330 /NCGR_PEP_ID=MMETSP0447-20121125/31203_1 /TAXON_ID=0 /ORGANISM="Stygamoeba regulata, Strain BSH-02190019" /LENGTH=682 /DNA_ID=CAMNT_0019191829 /DNA_START=278 /DNA_END=2326 /DNA_ORIENTATION=-